MRSEIWVMESALPWQAAVLAADIERMGFDGMVLTDSQNLAGECFVALAVAAVSTSTLRLGTGVANAMTRHPATLASAIASLNAVSGGRAVLGIGRGSSSLASVGLAPAPLVEFEIALDVLQRYLRGEDVAFASLPARWRTQDASTVLADGPGASRLRFLGDLPGLAKVPLDVAATGPRAIMLAARHAERVTFAVGTAPDRVRWALGLARDSRHRAGQPADLAAGAFVNIVIDDDIDRARSIGSGRLASTVRLNAAHDTAVATTTNGGPDVADRFGIFGPASSCVERLQELTELGLTRFVVIPPGPAADPEGTTLRRIADTVLPALG